jgi:hypothetical protein
MATLPKPDPSEEGELVEVFSSNRDSEALVVQGLLESADIQSLIVADVGPQDVLPVGRVSVKVSREAAERARQVIAESQKVSDAEMLDQSESNAGPTELPPQ